MKRTLVLVLSLAALAASAAWERVGYVEVAGTERICAAVTQFADLTGNAMLGGLATGALMQSDAVQFFGPTRPGRNVLLPLYVDGAKPAEKTEDVAAGVEYAVLYPVVATKAKFLKHHVSAVETNGCIRISGGCVKFSADGKWAAYSDKPEQVDLALAEAAKARRPLGDDLARVTVDEKGMDVLRRYLLAEAKDPQSGLSSNTCDCVRGLKAFSLSVGLGAKGLDFRFGLKTVPGTELDRFGRKALPANPLAFAAPDALCASASAADFSEESPSAKYGRTLSVLAKHGLALPFLTLTEKKGVSALTLDIAAAGRYFRAEATNALARLDARKLARECQKAADGGDRPLKLVERWRGGTFAIRGVKPKSTPAERLAATLPDLAAKKPSHVSVLSLVSLVRAVVPELVKLADGEQALMLKPLLLLIPAERPGGIATAAWREGDELKLLARVSADEMKSVSMLVMAVSAYVAQLHKDADEDDCDCGGDDGGED